MSMPMGMVMVFEAGMVPREKQAAVIAHATGIEASSERHASSQDTELIDMGDWLSDALMSMWRSPMGFDLLKLTWSPSALVCQPSSVIDTRMQSIERVAIACLDKLGVRFGYLTHYTNQLDAEWIEEEILVPLLCEDWNDLVAPLHHFVIHASGIPLPCPETAAVIHASEAGRIVRLGKHRSPFD